MAGEATIPARGQSSKTGKDRNATQAWKKVAPPWDLLRGRYVFRARVVLFRELNSSSIHHWAPNCCTFSRAREKLIPGARFSPKPLRSDFYPSGIPDVVASLPKHKRRKLDLDTQIADLSAEQCLQAHRAGKSFSLEHPRNSIARRLRTWEALESEPGVFSPPNTVHACLEGADEGRPKF